MFSAGAFVLAARIAPTELFAQAVAGFKSHAETAALHPSVYLGIEPDGTVFIVTHRSEMGTGIRTSLPLVAADELDADWKRVKVEQAIGDVKYGDQNTDGSRSIRDFYDPFRHAGASARAMLITAAAAQWSVPASECSTDLHEVVHRATNRRLGYGALVPAASKLPVPKAGEVQFKAKSAWRYVGKDQPIYDLTDIVTGKAEFGMDLKQPGMVYASIERPPVYGGKVRSVDDRAALAVNGVSQTVAIDPFRPPHGFQPLGGVAVIANSTWAAQQGRKKLTVNWDLGPHASIRFGAVQAGADQRGASAGQSRPQPRRRRQGICQRRKDARGDVLHAVARACCHGAAGGHRGVSRRQGDVLDVGPEPSGGAGVHRRGRRHRKKT